MDIRYNYTESKNAKFFRAPHKLQRIPWTNTEQFNITCHWGQRKLLYTEIEFLTIASQHVNIDKKECLIVSIGAANGAHTALYKELFPTTQFLMYDPAYFAIKADEQFIIKTDKEGFFADDEVQEVLKIADGRKILYICDIRMKTDELSIWENMKQQQRWGIDMGAEMMMLKMRLPFTTDITVDHDFSYSLDNIKDKVDVKDITNKQWNNLLYLDGDIYIQIHAPVRSTETRLITGKIKYGLGGVVGDGEKYALKYYDSIAHEEQMNHFNLHERNYTYSYKKSSDMVNHLLGYWNNYDTTGEYYICSKYLAKYKKLPYKHNDVIHLLHKINTFMQNKNITTTRSMITCPLVGYLDRINKYVIEFNSINKPVSKEQFDILNAHHVNGERVMKKMLELIGMVKTSFSKQIEIVKKSNILDDSEKVDELKIYHNITFRDGRFPIMTISDTNTIMINSMALRKIHERFTKAYGHFVDVISVKKA